MSLKVFARSTLIYSIGNIAVRLSTFLLIPLYTHYLSVMEYGLLSTMLLTTQILVMLIDFGMMPSLVRFSNEYEKENNTGLLLGSSILINLFSGLIVAIITIFFIKTLFELSFNISAGLQYSFLMIASSVFQCYSLNLLSHFRAINKAKFFIVISITQTIIYLLTTVLFVVKFSWGINGVFLAQIFSYGIFYIILLLFIIRDNQLKVSRSTISKLIKFGSPLIFARGGDLILDAFMLYTIGYFVNLAEVGIYSLAVKIASILLVLLIVPFQLSYEPYIYSQLEEKELPDRISKIFTYLILIFVFSSIVLLTVFKYFITIIAPPEYYSSYRLIFFIIPIYAFRGINSISQTLIHIQKRTNITGIIVFTLTIMAIIPGYFLIKSFGIYAAILISNLYWFSVSSVLFFFGQKLYPIKLESKRLIYLILIYIVFNIIIYSLSDARILIFCLVISCLLILTFYLLLKSRFFDVKERTVLHNSLTKLLSFIR